jgi:hypothetical protein
LYNTGSGGAATTFTGRAGLLLFTTAARFAGVRFTGRRLDRFTAVRDDVLRLALRAARLVRVARIVSALTEPLCHRHSAFASTACFRSASSNFQPLTSYFLL